MNRIILLGSTGYIGKKLLVELKKKFQVITIGRGVSNDIEFDLSHSDMFDYNALLPSDIIVHLAAISSPDTCKNKYDLAYSVNVSGTNNFIKNALNKGCKVLFYSSDAVYGHAETVFTESSICNPVGEYGNMKHEVEKTFIGNEKVKILRLSYVLSADDKYNKYLKSCYVNQNTAEIFDPFDRNVIYIDDLIEATINIISSWDDFKNQITNICGNEIVSRLDMAKYFDENSEKELKYIVTDPPKDFFKARPIRLMTNSLYLEKILGRKSKKISEVYKEIIID